MHDLNKGGKLFEKTSLHMHACNHNLMNTIQEFPSAARDATCAGRLNHLDESAYVTAPERKEIFDGKNNETQQSATVRRGKEARMTLNYTNKITSKFPRFFVQLFLSRTFIPVSNQPAISKLL